MQSKLGSLFEQVSSTAIGFIVSLLTWELVVKPAWGLTTSFIENLGITTVFTVISILRGYCVRRLFNRLHNNDKKAANETHRDHR